MTYTYITKKDGRYLIGKIEARHSFEALHNARIAAQLAGGDIKTTLIVKGEFALEDLVCGI